MPVTYPLLKVATFVFDDVIVQVTEGFRKAVPPTLRDTDPGVTVKVAS